MLENTDVIVYLRCSLVKVQEMYLIPSDSQWYGWLVVNYGIGSDHLRTAVIMLLLCGQEKSIYGEGILDCCYQNSFQ
jgi:hypothetical protein